MRSTTVAHWLGIEPWQLPALREARADHRHGWAEHAVRQRPGDVSRGGGRRAIPYSWCWEPIDGIVAWSRPVKHTTSFGVVTVRQPYGTMFRQIEDQDGTPRFWPRTSLIPNPCVRVRGGDRGGAA